MNNMKTNLSNYTIKSEELEQIVSFLETHPQADEFLFEGQQVIDIMFEQPVVELHYFSKCDNLMVVIKTELDAIDALEMVLRFDSEWYEEARTKFLNAPEIAVEMNDDEDFFLSEAEAQLYEQELSEEE